MNPIYPAIVPGLRVRHRETLEERTVTRISESVAYAHFESGFGNHFRTFWDRYEPLPQPGDRVRVIHGSGEGDHTECVGAEGILRPSWAPKKYWVGAMHEGPLSDFEVILPEESETNMTDFPGHSLPNTTMTDNETVAVPVELLKRWAHELGETAIDDLLTLLLKEKKA